MKTLLILGAGKEQVKAIDRAREKGIRTIVFDMNPQAAGASHADEFYPISTRDTEAVLGFLKGYKEKIDGVMTIASDIPHIVSAAAELLGVAHIPHTVAETCINKLKMKEVLKDKGVTVPTFRAIQSIEDLKRFVDEVGYPVVIKPVDNSGARGVLRLTSKVDLQWAFAYTKQFSYSGGMIAEKFIEGLQISTEGIMHENIFHCTGFADRNYTRVEETSPYLVEDGGDMPTVLDATDKKRVEAEFEKAVRALGINWGPAKGDMIFGTNRRAYVVEVAARLSGGNFCYDKVPWSTGVDIVDILIDMAVGNEIDSRRFEPTKNLATSQRYFFPRSGVIEEIRGLDRAAEIPFIKKIDPWVQAGDKIPEIVNHPSRVGYVIACAPTLTEAVQAAGKAVKTVEFVVQ